jgi:hypothetical protein
MAEEIGEAIPLAADRAAHPFAYDQNLPCPYGVVRSVDLNPALAVHADQQHVDLGVDVLLSRLTPSSERAR